MTYVVVALVLASSAAAISISQRAKDERGRKIGARFASLSIFLLFACVAVQYVGSFAAVAAADPVEKQAVLALAIDRAGSSLATRIAGVAAAVATLHAWILAWRRASA